MFCEKCGRQLDEEDKICPLCHTAVVGDDNNAAEDSSVTITAYTEPQEEKHKSRLTAGFLQIFLGSLGVGRFYMGYYGIGVVQILSSLVSCGVVGVIWGFVDGVRILCGHVEKDGFGNTMMN
jgi:TM2 domain-containing membrane protein YozV